MRVCDGVWVQGTGERRGQGVSLFVNRVLERGEDGAWRCLGTGWWREELRGCDGVWERGTGERRGVCVTVFGNRVQ